MRRYCVTVVDRTESDATLPCWRALLAMQRVSAGVAKALLLCIVTAIPLQADSPATPGLCASDMDEIAAVVPEHPKDERACDIGAESGVLIATQLQVEVIEVSRWAPEVSRRA
jgi:hypothetical protein